VITLLSVPRLIFSLLSVSYEEGYELYGSRSRETVKYGHESRGIRNEE
jgi:hypothetical protein